MRSVKIVFPRLGWVIVAVLVAASVVGPSVPIRAQEPEPAAGQTATEAKPETPAGRTAAEAEPEEAEAAPAIIKGGEFNLFHDLVIPQGTEHDGDVVCIGGNVRLEGRVTGDLVVIGGSARISGRVDGTLVAILSTVKVQEGARVGQDLVNVLGRLDRRGGRVRGELVNLDLGVQLPSLWGPLGVLSALALWIKVFKIVVLFLFMLILAALVPERLRTIGKEFPVRPGAALLAGLAAYVVLFLVMAVLIASVIGIPLAVFVWVVAFPVLKWMGVFGIFHFLGMRIGRLFGREVSMLGALLLAFVPYALLLILPRLLGLPGIVLAAVIGFVLWIALEVPGIGLVILTRAGGRPTPLPVAAPDPTPPPPDTP